MFWQSTLRFNHFATFNSFCFFCPFLHCLAMSANTSEIPLPVLADTSWRVQQVSSRTKSEKWCCCSNHWLDWRSALVPANTMVTGPLIAIMSFRRAMAFSKDTISFMAYTNKNASQIWRALLLAASKQYTPEVSQMSRSIVFPATSNDVLCISPTFTRYLFRKICWRYWLIIDVFPHAALPMTATLRLCTSPSARLDLKWNMLLAASRVTVTYGRCFTGFYSNFHVFITPSIFMLLCILTPHLNWRQETFCQSMSLMLVLFIRFQQWRLILSDARCCNISVYHRLREDQF